MFKKIARKACLAQYPKFPWTDHRHDNYFFPKARCGYILMLSSNSINRHAKNLATETVNLVQLLGVESLIFLGDTKTPWLYQQNDYKPANLALVYLFEKKVGSKFNGGFEISIDELAKFLTHLFWLVRCNATLPTVHFMNKKQDFLGSICKNGNIHFFALNKKCDSRLNDVLGQTSFKKAEK
ncbi:hypothetical protein ACX0G9_09850 [Flavitalea flava]